jgi:hypothetical protein
MVQAELAGGTDVHSWAQPDGFQTFQHFDGTGVIVLAAWLGWIHFFFSHLFS